MGGYTTAGQAHSYPFLEVYHMLLISFLKVKVNVVVHTLPVGRFDSA